MNIERIKALRGPNLWSRFTSVETTVEKHSDDIVLHHNHHVVSACRKYLPQLGELPYHYHLPNKHTEHHLNLATPQNLHLAHLLAAVTLEIQRAAGCPVTFSHTHLTKDQKAYIVVVQYTEEKVGRLAIEYANLLINALLRGETYDLTTAIKQLSDLDEDIRLGPSTGSIVQAAVRREIPFRRLTEGSMVQFGYGSKQKRILAAESSNTSAIAESIAQDKELTKKLLHAAGVPVPQGRPVNSAEDAWLAALEIGFPVAIKPRDGNQGKGISINLKTPDQLKHAYNLAYEVSADVIVERNLTGDDYRLLVVGDQLVAVARRDPAHVIGDGIHNIAQLVDITNQDPRRSNGHATSLTKIRLDEIAAATLKKQKVNTSHVPKPGQKIVLRDNANLSTGGTATDVTDHVHPNIAQAAITAVQMVGLDIAGVDLVCQHINKPLQEQGGGIVEINAAPGLRMHLDPSYGPARDVGQAIINNMFPSTANGRIPMVAVTGTNGKTTTVRLTAHLLAQSGLQTGWTCSDGIYMQGKRIDTGDCSGPKSARNLLAHPHLEAAVLETARGGILREGLGFDRCDIAIITNIGMGDHLGLNHINTAEELAAVKQVIVESVNNQGIAILNAEDPLTLRMAQYCPGEVLLFAQNSNNLALMKHRNAGHRVAYRTEQYIELAHGHSVAMRFNLSNIPLTNNGTLHFQVENAMCAISAAWVLGIAKEKIQQGLSHFISDSTTAPGRFNLFKHRGATVIADYGHNPDAMLALVKSIESIPAKQRLAVISGAGDRRNQDLSLQTQILGNTFDTIILYEDACNRGRETGEVLQLLRDGLKNVKKTNQVHEIIGEFTAINFALKNLNEGDLCLILIDQVDAALEHLKTNCTD